jgi:hypothetical protein
MRSKDFLYETIEIICEKTTADELIPYLEPLGFDVEKKTGTTIKVVVPASLRSTGVQQIASTLPGATISADGKKVQYDGSTILVKPAEAQGGRLEKEAGQLIAIDTSIKEHLKGKPFIKLAIGERVVNAAGAVNVPGNPKADIAIVDNNGTQVAWISLKDGTNPKGFGQWGGVDHLGTDPEVSKFVQGIRAAFGDQFPRGPTYGVSIKNPQLKALTVFGKGFGGSPGINNVDLVLQGHPTLTKGSRGGYVLTGAHSWHNGDIPTGEYEPMLIVRFSSDRGNFGIAGARISSYPAGGRPVNPLPKPAAKAKPALKAPTTAPAPKPASIQNMQKPLGTSKIPMGTTPPQ